MTRKSAEDTRARGWRTSPELWRELRAAARGQRRRGTPAEERLWQALRGRKLGVKFRRQHAIDRFIVDFYCAEHALVVEVDGEIHRLSRLEDAERGAFPEMLGFKVIRFTNEQVMDDCESILAVIAANLTPGPSPISERGG